LNKRAQYISELRPFSTDSERITAYLLAHSNLPGKRGNLELAFAFAGYIEELYPAKPELVLTFCEALVIKNPPLGKATGSEEFLPFCGVLSLGRICKIDPIKESDVLVYVKTAAQDERWRIREAAAMAIQDLIDVHPETTIATLRCWVHEESYLLLRAVAAGIAEPRFMKKQEIARVALELHKTILEKVANETDRHNPDYAVLVKGLCYTLSVVITGIEKEGFDYLEDLLAMDHPVIRKIVRENLKKKRLLRLNAGTVSELQLKLDK
jgi:hypothetical protein